MERHRMSLRLRTAVSLFVAAAVCGAAPRLDALLATIAAAAGASDGYRAQIERAEGTGAARRTERIAWDGRRRLARACTGEICAGTWFDGTRAYTLDANDVPIPETPQGTAYLRTLDAIETHAFALPAFRDAGGTVADVTPADAPVAERRFAVRAPRGTTLLAILDAEANLVEGVMRADGGERLTLADYAHGEGGAVATVRTAATRNAFAAASPAPLAAPTGIPLMPNALPPAPFARSDPRPYFACTAAGIAARCLLDTGAGGLDVSLAFAERLGLEPAGTVTLAGVGSYLTGFVRIPELVLPGARVGSALYAVAPDLDLHGCDIVVGSDVLAEIAARVDFGKRTVAFAATADEAGSATPLPLRFGARLPYLAARVGKAPADLVLDTGDDSAIDLGAAYFERTKPFVADATDRRREGTGGTSAALEGRLDSLVVGTIQAGPVRAIVTDRLRGEGHLGSAFFAGRTLVLDYAHDRILVR
jgi:hypothetical protein